MSSARITPTALTESSKGAGCSGIATFAQNASIRQRDPNSLLPLIILSLITSWWQVIEAYPELNFMN
jgi:hypothetical protein